MKPYFFDGPILPAGFRFPEPYREFVRTGESLRPWHVLAFEMDSSLYYWATLRKRFPELCLVPFAVYQDGPGLPSGDGITSVACFDGADRTGSPRVLMYSYEHPRVPPSGTPGYADFDAWLEAARREVSAFHRLAADDEE